MSRAWVPSLKYSTLAVGVMRRPHQKPNSEGLAPCGMSSTRVGTSRIQIGLTRSAAPRANGCSAGLDSGNFAQRREFEASGFQTVDDQTSCLDGIEAVRLAIPMVPGATCASTWEATLSPVRSRNQHQSQTIQPHPTSL
jgi:hypothetical protein